ncbi:EthD family reductase [Dankookia sp. GCM10030260]|uniref:EthD family reductase n=1 Tax=Dankookia sp. GCM10030260 TaxID=3273390 RepID=UPI00360E377E
MIVVSVSYPNDPATKFDHAYYLEKHIPLVKQRWSSMGLQSVQVLRGVGTADGGPPPIRLTALLGWESGDALGKAIAAHGDEIFADIANFTDSKPALQINEPAG